jgi:DNA polymerase III subunit alpha, Gram-positive type
MDYTVLDLETTGLSRYYDKIIEIAAVRYRDGQKHAEFHTFVNPNRKIPSFITSLTGINNQMVENAPTIKEVLPKFKSFLENSVIVAHNATFDHGFLSYNYEKHLSEELVNKKICTRKLANRILPDLPSKRLSSLCNYFNIVNEQEHRAMGDTMATITLFHHFRDVLNNKGLNTINDVSNFESWPVYKCKRLLENVQD